MHIDILMILCVLSQFPQLWTENQYNRSAKVILSSNVEQKSILTRGFHSNKSTDQYPSFKNVNYIRKKLIEII